MLRLAREVDPATALTERILRPMKPARLVRSEIYWPHEGSGLFPAPKTDTARSDTPTRHTTRSITDVLRASRGAYGRLYAVCNLISDGNGLWLTGEDRAGVARTGPADRFSFFSTKDDGQGTTLPTFVDVARSKGLQCRWCFRQVTSPPGAKPPPFELAHNLHAGMDEQTALDFISQGFMSHTSGGSFCELFLRLLVAAFDAWARVPIESIGPSQGAMLDQLWPSGPSLAGPSNPYAPMLASFGTGERLYHVAGDHSDQVPLSAEVLSALWVACRPFLHVGPDVANSYSRNDSFGEQLRFFVHCHRGVRNLNMLGGLQLHPIRQPSTTSTRLTGFM